MEEGLLSEGGWGLHVVEGRLLPFVFDKGLLLEGKWALRAAGRRVWALLLLNASPSHYAYELYDVGLSLAPMSLG